MIYMNFNHYRRITLFKIILYLFGISTTITYSQTITNKEALRAFANKKHTEYKLNQKEVVEYSNEYNVPIFQVLPNGQIHTIIRIENGIPIYNTTTNTGAAQTIQVDKLWPGGSLNLDLSGNGYNKVAIWDGGRVRTTHQEFDGRVTHIDAFPNIYDHPTHVAGTLVAQGQNPLAKGMDYESNLDSYVYDDDMSEMATAAIAGLELSNHSYVHGTGWTLNPPYTPYWRGDLSVSSTEEYRFGYYSAEAEAWDNIAYNAPFYLILKAGGNDRDDNHVGPHRHAGDSVTIYNDSHDPDGGADRYDCIPDRGAAKNIITVGAVEKVLNYLSPLDVVMSQFSSWGPTDDGRIKPDLVAKGVQTYSSFSSSNAAYGKLDGTSFATPSIAGALLLLRQHYQNINNGSKMLSATLKGLAIHTANEAGPTIGPDYMFGWGLLNAETAAELITIDSYGSNVIDEQVLSSGGAFSRNIYSDGTKPLRVTICWTDPAGTPVNPPTDPELLNNRTPMLVNDLDLLLIEGGTTYYQWKLDPDNPSNAATISGKNYVDNVEQVFIQSPIAGIYTIQINHDGSLTNGSQAFSIIVSGDSNCESGSIIYNSDSEKFNFCENGYWIEK